MVKSSMRKYRTRSEAADQLVADSDAAHGIIEPELIFGRQAPLRLEIGFGHGQFMSQMAAAHREENFIGVEFNPLRVNKTAHKSNGFGCKNVRLYQGEAHSFVRYRIPAGSCKRIYALFLDPWPRPKHRRRRLFTRAFLLDCAYALAPKGQLIIGTDHHNYAMQTVSNVSTLPRVFRSLYPNGFRFNINTRFATVFETHKKEEGHRCCYLKLERSDAELPSRLPFRNPSFYITHPDHQE